MTLARLLDTTCHTTGFTTSVLMDPDFAVTCPLVRRRRPLIQFLYIGPYLCSTLPSAPPHGDALALCYASTPSGWDGTFTRSCRPCAAYKQKAPGMVGGLLG